LKTELPNSPVCFQAASVKLPLGEGKTNLPATLLLCALFMVASHRTSGQLGTWNIVNLKSKINDKWSYFIEAQMRSLSFYSDMNYYEVKGLAAYSVNPNFQVGAGMGSYNTFQNEGNFTKPMINREFRTWQQAVLRQNAGRLKMEHRYRAEQRFTSNGYRNRFRYRFNLALPLNHREVVPGTFYLMVWDEIFLNNRAPVFERNRFFAGCGYELSATTAIQSGFLSQYDYDLTRSQVRKYLQISLLLTLHAEKEKTWFRQGVPD
jgi:hypothetical protein